LHRQRIAQRIFGGHHDVSRRHPDKQVKAKAATKPGRRFHWNFEDPAALTGTPDEKTREVRDKIRSRVNEFGRKGSPD